MLKFILKRILSGVVTLWIVTTITFFLMHALPGDPFASEKAIPPKIKANLMKKYHLDKPLVVQYVYYLGGIVKGDFGMSMKVRGRKVSRIIARAYPISLDLGMRAIIFAFIFGIFFGIIGAFNRGKWEDTGAMAVAIIGVSVPSFIIAGTLQWIDIFVSKKAGISLLPVAGYDSPAHKIMPTIALGLMAVAVIARMMRASMIEVLNQDYIKTAKSKGLASKIVIWKHAFRNAIMPVITYLGPLIAAITTGSFVIEKVFAIPGLGKYYVESIYNRDYTMVLGITVFYSLLLIVMVLIVDILYGFIDPRVRIGKGRE
ncbi:ABC transporter permease [Haliovirga abyssi]|uniref:Oligopeptide transport system permease protein OppB n=1 Tax=Haliovirga abyssi TaxID=2996794 RepID=A0AAU9DRR4_9FUSO|nr:ABC transporter permease [Haliovirga abyssi]BDU49644.1 oligopeptide transport system permease protein OppB [Haliovirga abyssi]